jgi:hypothetical protein
MAEGSKKMEPWQLILILILVLAFFGGLYLMNQAITSQLESIEGAIDAKTETIKSGIDSVNRRLDNLRAMQSQSRGAAPAPAAEPSAEPVEGEAQPTADAPEPEQIAPAAEPERKE